MINWKFWKNKNESKKFLQEEIALLKEINYMKDLLLLNLENDYNKYKREISILLAAIALKNNGTYLVEKDIIETICDISFDMNLKVKVNEDNSVILELTNNDDDKETGGDLL